MGNGNPTLDETKQKILDERRRKELEKERPNDQNGAWAWDITRRRGPTHKVWFNAFRVSGGGNSIENLADRMGLDPVALLAALMARYGIKPPDLESSWKSYVSVAKRLKTRKETESLDTWFQRAYPKRYAKNTTPGAPAVFSTPEQVLQPAASRGYVAPDPEAPSAAAEKSLFDRVSPAWQGVMDALKRHADEITYTRQDGDTVKGLGVNNLLAALWSQGKTAKEIQDDLNNNNARIVTTTAQNLAERGPNENLNKWFRRFYGEGAQGRPPPERFLRGVDSGRGVPVSGTTKDRNTRTERDRTDPVIFKNKGIEFRSSDMQRAFSQFSHLWQFYQGRNPDSSEMQEFLTSGKSTYQLSIELSNDPRFFRSPAWKKERLTYIGAWNDVMGATKRKPPRNLIRKAIINQWNAGQFAEALRGRSDYLESNEFAGKNAELQESYARIYGGPITEPVRNMLKEASLARWSKDQWETWLRGQPQYGTSTEFKKKMNTFAVNMGRAFGTHVRLPNDLAPPVTPPSFDLPDSERIEGQAGFNRDPNKELASG